MKKKIISLLLAVVMIVGMLPLSAITAFAEDKANGEYTITNEAPESKKDINNGYVYVQETAEAGAEVTITVYPNEGYELKTLAVKYQSTDASQDDSSEQVFSSPIFRQIGGTLPTDAKIVADERLDIGTGSPLMRVNTAEICTVELATGTPDNYSFTMPAYPVTVVAEFGLTQWTDWEPFDIGTGEWNFSVLSGQSGFYDVEVCKGINNSNLKLIKVKSWGKDTLVTNYPGIDLILEWDAATNIVTIPLQSTYLVEVSSGQEVLITDYSSLTLSPYKQSYYDASKNTFFLTPVYLMGANAYYNNETLVIKEKETSEKLQYDSEEADFSATFKDDTADIEIVYDHDEDEWVALVHATDSALHTVALCVYLPNGCTEIPAGTFSINGTMEESTVQASSGIVNGSQVTYSFAGNRNSQGYITTPIWFMVGGTVTVSYEGNVMTMVIDAVNSYGKDIDVTIEKTIPAKHSITDATTDPNGSVLVDQTPAEEGSAVTLTVRPNDGYRLKAGTLKAVYNDGGEKQVDLTQDPAEKNKFTFTMPTADVTVTAEFEEAEDTFKAVWNAKTGVLSFFYDKLNHMDEGISVFDELPTEVTAAADWPYDSIREDVAEVQIDASVANYTGLKSTAYMFDSMYYASGITGAENLKIDNVTNMACMFYSYGFLSVELDDVPDVSGWNTENVTDMSQMFWCYGYYSETLNFSLDLSGWDLSAAENVGNMFSYAGADATVWKVCIPYMTGELKNTPTVWYGKDNTVFAVPATDKQFTLIYPVTHDLSIKNGNVDAVEGTDYDWDSKDPNQLTIKTDGLTVSGSTTKEYIVVAENVGELTIDGLTIINADDAIYFSGDDGKLILKGDNYLIGNDDGDDAGVYFDGDGVISGSGTLTVTVGGDGIYAYGMLTISASGSINTQGDYYGIISNIGDIHFENTVGKVLASGNSNNYGAIVVWSSDCSMTVADGLTIKGSTEYSAEESAITDAVTFNAADGCVKLEGDGAVAKSVLITGLGEDEPDTLTLRDILGKVGGTYSGINSSGTSITITINSNEFSQVNIYSGGYAERVTVGNTDTKIWYTETFVNGQPVFDDENYEEYKDNTIETILNLEVEILTENEDYYIPAGSYVVGEMLVFYNEQNGVTQNSIYLGAVLNRIGGAEHEHTFSDEWSNSPTHHWHDATCGHTEFVSGFGAHTFDEGVTEDNKTTYTCTVCGYQKIVYNTAGDNEGEIIGGTSYTGISLTLGSDIAINFYMDLTDEARQNGTMTFDIGGRIVTLKGTDAKYNETEKKYYFQTPLTALEMNETVKATFIYNGVEYVQEYSVQQYIDKIVSDSEKYGEKAVALAKKIANYGHYAQIYLESIHTNVTIGDDGYAEMERFNDVDINVAKAIEALAKYSVKVTGTSDNISLYGSTVYFDSATALNYYVTVKDGKKPTATALNTKTGKSKDVEIKLYKGNIYIVSVKDITATELADDIEVTINDDITVTGSVFAYCNSVVKAHDIDGATAKDKFAVDAMAAFYEYYEAACEYAKTQVQE